MRRILLCRTEKLGGHAWECKACNHTKVAYNSCKNRHCPQCSEVGISEWIVRTTPKILERDHFHLIFSIPEELNVLWLKNTKMMIHLLFKATTQTLETFYRNELGVKPGCMLNLHTWSRNLNLHPHIHCLATAGGYDKKGCWHDSGNFIFPIRGMSKYFRTRFLVLIREHAEQIEDPRIVEAVIEPLFEKNWNVFISKKYEHGRGVIKYLARYVKGGPIKNKRIVSYDGSFVSFRYTDHRDNKSKVMRLPVDEFMRRIMLHFIPKRQRTLRFFGFYASRKNYVAPRDNDNSISLKLFAIEPDSCPHCSRPMHVYPNLTGVQLKRFIPPPVPTAA